MSTRETCPRTEHAVAWALHVLEPAEADEMSAHLAGCAECRVTVAETEETLAALGGGLAPEEPPAGLRNRILDVAAETPQETPQETPPESAWSPLSAPKTDGSATEPWGDVAPGTGTRSPRPDSRGPGSRSLGAGSSAAGSAPRAGGTSGPARGGRSGPGRGRHGRPAPGIRGRVIAVATAALVALGAIAGLGVYSAQLKSERDAEAARAQSLVAMVQQMATPGTAHAFLSPAGGGPAVAAVVATPTGRQAVLPVGLPANPGDHVYVLWGLPGSGAPAPLGTFDVRDDALDVQSVGSAPDGTAFAQFAISIEPGRAAPASPSDVVASGRAEL
ncbi:anti-sigma factor domain-containing protein [Pseudonocardia xishanensis]|uniref:Regulator of SigK n=1 Tax=Pseudonocardia xishanensis TaxID=630995 RepID=A0ABP8RS52_9PSEU